MEQLKPGACHCNYSRRPEKFRAMKLIALVGILERQLFQISSLHFRAMMQSYEHQNVFMFVAAPQRSETLFQYFFALKAIRLLQ